MNDEYDRQPASAAELPDDSQSQSEELRTTLTEGLVRFAAWFDQAIQHVGAVLARPEVKARVDAFVDAGQKWARQVEAVESPGYAPYFERLGRSPFAARLQTHEVRYLSWRQMQQYQDERVALTNFHALARRRRWHPSLLRRVACLKQQGSNLRFLDEAFRRADCPEQKEVFVSLLEPTLAGDASAGAALIAVAARVAPHAPSPRGRHMGFDTVLHRTFLTFNEGEGGHEAYTYAPLSGDFIDAATQATRLELNRPGFNPVASRRSMKKVRKQSSI